MANLLESASVVLTPTAYNNGKALCIKPDDGSGDFDFSRNSAATRVNAQGLVEDVQILSSNLVQNGDFSQLGSQEITNGNFSQQGSQLIVNGDFATDSDWNLGGSDTPIIENGFLKFGISNGTYSRARQNNASIIGNCKVTYTVVNSSASTLAIREYAGGNNESVPATIGTHTIYKNFIANGISFQAGGVDGGVLEIDNVSVVEVGQDWTIASGSGWSIGEDKIIGVNSLNFSAYQASLVSGKTYKITYEVKDYVSGTFGIRANTAAGLTVTANGVYTDYITSNGNKVYLMGFGTFNGSVTNISVKEVGQNWFKDANWSIGYNVATSTGGGRMFQSISALEGNTGTKVKVSFNITEVTSGGVKVDCYGAASSVITEVGTHTFTGTTTNSLNLYINNSGTGNLVGSVTNISVIEITNDTNLPRINYEGFSYQDALGSEEITNGDFSSGATGWVVGTGWSVVDGKANKVSGTESDINQTNGLATQGLSYLFSYDVNLTSGTVQAAVKGGSGQLFNTVGTHTVSEIIVAGSGPTDFKITAKSGFNGSVDNVSVKEYKGQEVVPSSGCGNWLWEPQSTNLITYSEDFTQWDKINSNVISINETNPINSVAYEIESTVSSNKSRIYYNSLMVSGSSYSTSYLVKPSSNSPQYLGFACISNTTPDVFYNFSNNQFEDNTIVGNAAKCESIQMLNGWRLLKVPIHNNVTNTRLNIYQGGISGGELIGVNGQSYYLKFAQLEEQSYVTSYIPTDGTTVTRNQDACTNGGSVSTINSTEGVLYAEIAALANENVQRILSISDGTHNNTVKLGFLNSATDYRLFADIRLGGVNQAFLTFNFGAVAPTFKKCAIKYKQNDFALWIDGVEVATDTSGNTFSANTLNELTFTRGDAAQNFFGETKCLAVWKEALTDTQLAELTTI